MNKFGKYNPDGSIASYPEVSILGGVIANRQWGSRVNVGNHTFVVVPPNWVDEDGSRLEALKKEAGTRSFSIPKKGETDES